MNTTTPPDTLDLEARAHSEHAHELRLWLRLLTCSQLIEKRVRTGLREQFDTTLPRFDLMAQLERHPEGLKMKELSHRLMVTGGNVTGITDQLVTEGLVERQAVDGDRRAFRVRLTPEGRSALRAHGRAARTVDRRCLRRSEARAIWTTCTSCWARSSNINSISTNAWAQRRSQHPMKHPIPDHNPMRGQYGPLAPTAPKHFALSFSDGVATVTLNRPERKNPLTFDSYAELRDWFLGLQRATDIKAVVLTGAGDNFCSGGDVHEIIGPLTKMTMPELLAFTRMTGALVSAMRACPQPIVAALDGVCAGAGAMMALASDLRLGTPAATVAFLFTRVGLAGADMGACALLPRMIGQGRASELLLTGRAMTAPEGQAWGFFNALHESDALLPAAHKLAAQLAQGPTFAHGMTKTMLHQEWAMTLDQAIEAEAQAQAICMQTQDFKRAYDAFAAKQTPVVRGRLNDRHGSPSNTPIPTARCPPHGPPRTAVLRRRPPRHGQRTRRLGRRTTRGRIRRPRRLQRLGAAPGRRWLAALLRGGRAWWRPARARFALPGDPARDARLPLAAGRLCLCHARPGQRCPLAGAARPSSRRATCRPWPAARRSPPLR